MFGIYLFPFSKHSTNFSSERFANYLTLFISDFHTGRYLQKEARMIDLSLRNVLTFQQQKSTTENYE